MQSPAKESSFKLTDLSTRLMNDIYEPIFLNYNLTLLTDFPMPGANPAYYLINFLLYVAAKNWDMVPNDMENIHDFGSFQKMILTSGCKMVAIVGYNNYFNVLLS